MADIATLGIEVRSDQVRSANDNLDRLAQTATRTERATLGYEGAARRAETATQRMARQVTVAERAMGVLRSAAAGLIAAFGARELARLADAWSDITARVNIAAGSMEQGAQVMERLESMARRTYSGLAQTAEGYIQNAGALRELGYATGQALDYQEALNNALVVSGARAERATQVQNALTQAMALGELRGQQLNTVIMNGGRVAEVLAEELGVGVNQLRALGQQGAITGDVIYNALVNRLELLREQADGMPATIGDAFTILGDAVLGFVGRVDQAMGASEGLAQAIIAVADAISRATGPIVQAAGIIADNFQRLLMYAMTAAAYFAVQWVASFNIAAAATGALNAALIFLRANLVRIGIGAVIVLAGELAYQFMQLIDRAGGFAQAMVLLGNVAAEVWQRIQHGGQAMGFALRAVAQFIQGAFLEAWRIILQGFQALMGAIEGPLNSIREAFGIGGPIELVQGLGRAIEETGRASELAFHGMNRDFNLSRQHLDEMLKPLQSIADLSGEVEDVAGAFDELAGTADSAGGSMVGASDAADRLSGALGGAGGAAATATNQALEEFIRTADRLAERMFPGEYARREAEELAAALALYGDALDDFQRRAVEARIADQFRAAQLGVRELEDQVGKSSRGMADTIEQTLGSVLADLFKGPLEDMDQFFDKMLRGFAQIGQANLQATIDGFFGGGMTAANDNDPVRTLAKRIGAEVKAGAAEGSAVGSATGIASIFGQGSVAGGVLSAGLGGLGLGYESENPMMGALGGAISGWSAGASITALGAAGGPLGMLVGGVAGLLGGIFGRNNREAQERYQAQMELEKNMGAIQTLLAQGEGTGVGELATTLRDFYDEIAKANEVARKAGDNELGDRLQNSWNLMFIRMERDFVRSFEGAVGAYSSGQGSNSPFIRGVGAIESLREELKGFVADVEYINEQALLHNIGDNAVNQARMEEQLSRARMAVQQMVLTTISGVRSLTAMESAVEEMAGKVAAAQTTLEELGMSAEMAAHAIEGSLNLGLAKLHDQFIGDLNRSINELSGAGWLNDLMDAQSKYQERLRDGAALGLDASLAMREFELSLRDVVTSAGLSRQEIEMLGAAFPHLAEMLGGIVVGASGISVDQARSNLRRAYDAERSALEQLIRSVEQFTRRIREMRDAMRLGPTSPLAPEQRVEEAMRQFREVAALAMAGDEEAMGRLTNVGQAALDEARSYHQSSEAYFKIWEEIDSTLAKAEANGMRQLSEAQQQLQAQRDAVSKLIDLNDGVLSVADAIRDLHAANDNHAKWLADALANLSVGGTASNTINAAYQASLGRAPDAAGQAYWQGQASAGKPADQIAAEIANSREAQIQNLYRSIFGRAADAAGMRYWYDSGLGIDRMRLEMEHLKSIGAYQMGGYTGNMATNAVAGVVHGQEFVAHAEATRRWRPQLEAMNSGTYGGQGDNREVVAAIDRLRADNAELRSEVRRLGSIIAQSDEATRQKIDQGNAELGEISSDLKLARSA